MPQEGMEMRTVTMNQRESMIEFLCLTILLINELAANQLCSQNIPSGSFKELEFLQLSSTHNLKNMCSSSVAKGLSKLKELVIQNCSKMEEVIQIDRNENENNEMVSLFPHLETLKLQMMEELKRFCQIKNELDIKLLEHVEIKSCPKLQTFNDGTLSTPSLKVLRIDDHDMQSKQLNRVLQQEYQKNHPEIEPKKTYFTISASDLEIDSKSGDWTWPMEQEANGESFLVAELHKAQYLEVGGRLEISKLVLGLTYEVMFVIMLREPVRGWEEAVSMRLILPNGGILYRKESFKAKPRRRYIEIKVGEFKALEKDNDGDIEFAMIQQNKNVVKRGLVVKGAVVRQKPELVVQD